MAFPSLAVIAQKLSTAEIERLLVLKRIGPKLGKLESKRKTLAGQLADLDKQIAALGGEATPKTTKRRGRKPGRKPSRPAKGKPGRKRGRPAKASIVPAKRGSGRPPKNKPAAKSSRPRARPALSGPEAEARRKAMLANLAKARAVRAANRKVSG